MENEDANYWIVDNMKLTISNEQMLKAVLGVAGIELGKSACYVSNITLNDSGDWRVEILGQE